MTASTYAESELCLRCGERSEGAARLLLWNPRSHRAPLDTWLCASCAGVIAKALQPPATRRQ